MNRWILVFAVCPFAVSASYAAVIPVPDEQTWRDAVGSRSQVDFEMFTGPVGSQYPGIAFEPFNDGSPYATDQFPHDGANSIFTVENTHGGGGWAAGLETPARGFAFWSGDVEFMGTTVTFYDNQSNLLGTFDLLEVGGGNGPYVYGFNGFLSDSPDIARVEVTIDPADAVWFDDVQFGSTETASVTEDEPGLRLATWGAVRVSFRR